VIVNDGSTDRTKEIVKKHCALHRWIELVDSAEHKGRDFGGKVAAFEVGRSRFKALSFDLIGNIDADISFEPSFFDFLLHKFNENPRLGIAGAPFVEDDMTYDYRFSSANHVSGACQLFRRECYEDIGGYIPIRGGGIDVAAVLSARMKGWETISFLEKSYLHHRKMGTAKESYLRARFRNGIKDFSLGSHPLWETLRSIYQMTHRPYFIGGLAVLSGYVAAIITMQQKVIPADLIAFRRRDEMRRLRSLLYESLNGGDSSLRIRI